MYRLSIQSLGTKTLPGEEELAGKQERARRKKDLVDIEIESNLLAEEEFIQASLKQIVN